jgi:phytoene synthase
MAGDLSVDATQLREGYRACERITRRNGTTYYWGTRLLPADRRRHVYAVYALARLADDIVDEAEGRSVAETTEALTGFERRFWTAFDGGECGDPVLAAVVTSLRACEIEPGCLRRFFGAMRQDLWCSSYATWDDLLGYMDGSAAVIGEMMLPVLRPRSPAAFEPARALGLAFQLTNFLRDVGEDLDRGRVYLPQEDLHRFGADPASRSVTPQWRALMRFQIERNRDLYRQADAGIHLLPGSSARCVATARVLYSQILDRVEARDYDVFGGRARVPTGRKALVAGRMLVSRRPVRLVDRMAPAQ